MSHLVAQVAGNLVEVLFLELLVGVDVEESATHGTAIELGGWARRSIGHSKPK